MTGIVGVAGGIVTVISVMVSGWFSLRSSRSAAAAQEHVAATQVAPQQKQVDLSVLQATTERVDRENTENRTRISRLEAILRAFVWTADRWATQMRRAGIEPEPPHPLVDEYNRTGV